MERYFEIFTELPLPAAIIEPGGLEVEVNSAFRNCFPTGSDNDCVLAALRDELLNFQASPAENELLEKSVSLPGEQKKTYRVRLTKLNHSLPPRLLLLFTDITERRRQLEEIGRLASIVDSSDDAIISVSLGRKIMSWNHGAEKIFGYQASQVLDSSIMKIVPSGMAGDFEAMFSQAGRGESVVRRESVCQHLDSHIFPVSLTMSPLVFHDEIVGVTMVLRDISSRRLAEEELKISHRRLKSLMYETVESLSTAHEKRDLYTSGHQRVVSMTSCCIADEMNLPHDRIEGIRIAGLLHDIGKVCIPMAILSKPAALSPEEQALMRKHPEAGYEIVKNVPFTWPVKDIILQHHERLDGSGYPHGLKGDSIMLEARILAVADVLEAMSSHRPYRPALGLEAAMEELRKNDGLKYDPQVCRAVYSLFTDGVLRVEQSRLICSL